LGSKDSLNHLRRQVKSAVDDAGANIIYGSIDYKNTKTGYENGFW
jgi:hypothetical protein